MELQNLAQYNWKIEEIEERAKEEKDVLAEGLVEFVEWLISLAPTKPTTIFARCFLAIRYLGDSQHCWWTELITEGHNNLDFRIPTKIQAARLPGVTGYDGYWVGRELPRELGEYWNTSCIPAIGVQIEALSAAWADHITLEFTDRGLCGGRIHCTLVR